MRWTRWKTTHWDTPFGLFANICGLSLVVSTKGGISAVGGYEIEAGMKKTEG